jgi:hypothetical protein
LELARQDGVDAPSAMAGPSPVVRRLMALHADQAMPAITDVDAGDGVGQANQELIVPC